MCFQLSNHSQPQPKLTEDYCSLLDRVLSLIIWRRNMIHEVDTRPPEKIPNSGGQGEEGKDREGQEEDEEEGECGFCLFMKAGGCKDSFIAWEHCFQEAEKNKEHIVKKCLKATGDLKKCMEAQADYYEPILKAEKVLDAEATKELEKEALEQNVGSQRF